MLQESSETESPPEPEREALASLVGRLGHAMQEALSRGDVAALRRTRPEAGVSPSYFKVAAVYLEPAGVFAHGGRAVREQLDRRWASILSAMAIMEGLHAPSVPLGRALGHADYAEPRLLRLLRARGEALFDAVRVTSHFLASKGQHASHVDVARLVLSDGRADEEMVRRWIARDYYSVST
ncbi:MAG: type I-E CRISPR-associated protein Cse2/CasB [Myxococcota bacterium]